MNAPAFPVADGVPIDTVFTYSRAGQLEVSYGGDPLAAWRHFSSLVARDPLDIEAQVRRVLLTVRQSGLRDRAFGALLDLFLALGPQGRELRRLMLDAARGAIEPDEFRFLQAHLDDGLARNALLPAGTGAVLDAAVLGSAHAVQHERVAAPAASRVDEAISLLDHGDLPGARRLLEDVLLDDPLDEVATRELLAIYHHSRDSEGRQAMQARLRERHGTLPPAWA